jgi:hypothetical protein
MKHLQLMCLLLFACQQTGKTPEVSSSTFEPAVSQGVIEGNKIREASGLAASFANPGMLWTHNDSGNRADIFLISEKGELKCTVHLSGIKNRDWEDIAVAQGSEGDKHYIYLAEIGDNDAVYSTKFLYRIEEPKIAAEVSDTTLHQIDRIEFKLSDGARDTEALMIDPGSKNIYIFSKRERRVNLYKISVPLSTTAIMTAEKVLEELPFSWVVAADLSADGNEILVKNYDNVYYWKRSPGETIEDAVKRTAERLPYTPEPQGEAIAFDPDGTGYYTLSEQKKKMAQHLYFYKRK